MSILRTPRVLQLSLLGLLCLFSSLTQAQEVSTEPSTADRAEGLQNRSYNDPITSSPIVLAHPMLDAVPNFLDDLDSHLMSDELVNQLEDRYSAKLRSYSLQHGLIMHNRNSRVLRTYYGTSEEEIAVRNEMARAIKHYMLVRGLPRFLTSKESTRSIGENYTKAVQFAQNAARVDIKSADKSWSFNAGLNPFSTKAWSKYSNKKSTIELYNFFNKEDTLAIIAFTRIKRYIPKIQYHIAKKAIEPGVKLIASRTFEAEYRIYIPMGTPNFLNSAVNYVAAHYRF